MDAIVTANIRGVMPSPRITVEELGRALGGSHAPLVVDVRLPAEYRSVHLEPSVSLPLDEIGRRRAELPRDRELVLVCRTGARARLAAAELGGLRPRVLEGGISAWQEAGSPRHRRQGPREPRASGPHRGRRHGVRRRRSGPRVQPVVRPAARLHGRRPRLCRDHRSVWDGDAAGQAALQPRGRRRRDMRGSRRVCDVCCPHRRRRRKLRGPDPSVNAIGRFRSAG